MGNLIRIGTWSWPDPSTKKQRKKKPKRSSGYDRQKIWIHPTLRASILLFFRIAILAAMLYGFYDYGRRAM